MAESNKIDGMHGKFVNMGSWVAGLVDTYMPEDCIAHKEEIKDAIEAYFKLEENYINVYFSAIPGLMSAERSKTAVMNIRALKNEEQRKEAVEAILDKAKYAKAAIDTFLNIPPDQLDLIVKKFSLYVNLFTDMYVVK